MLLFKPKKKKEREPNQHHRHRGRKRYCYKHEKKKQKQKRSKLIQIVNASHFNGIQQYILKFESTLTRAIHKLYQFCSRQSEYIYTYMTQDSKQIIKCVRKEYFYCRQKWNVMHMNRIYILCDVKVSSIRRFFVFFIIIFICFTCPRLRIVMCVMTLSQEYLFYRIAEGIKRIFASITPKNA